MMDYCLQNSDEAAFDTLMVSTGLCVIVEDGEGHEQVVPASSNVLIDRIGPITIGDVVYPEYYTNIRLLSEPSEQQVQTLNQYAIDPSAPQYRVWA